VAVTGGQALVSTRFGLELEGTLADLVSSAEGGDPSSDVVVEQLGADLVVHKHIAGVRYSEIAVTCGPEPSTALSQWIDDTLDRRPSRKSGAIVTYDTQGKEASRLSFTNALISEIGFPKLDAGSKDSARLTIKLAPELTRRSAGSGAAAPLQRAAAKKWLPANFRLTIDGLDCTHVSKIEALSIRQAIVEQAAGSVRDFETQPSHLEIPDVVATMPESHASDFYAWLDDFVVKGRSSETDEKNGTLEFLSSDLKHAFFTLDLRHLGIFKLALDQAASESIRNVTASMYCEEMSLTAARELTAATFGSPLSRADTQTLLIAAAHDAPPTLRRRVA
jgi:phage tail-like protein